MANTPLLGLTLPVTGTLSGTWGDTVNNEITSLLDSAVAGTYDVTVNADYTLTSTASAVNDARNAILLFTGARTAIRTVTAPARSKMYVVQNQTTGGYSVKLVGAGPTTGLTILNGEEALVAWSGTDFVRVSTMGGPITGSTGVFTGNVSGVNGTFTGPVSGTTGTFTGAVSGTTGTFTSGVVAQGLTVGRGSGTGTNTAVGVSALVSNTASGGNTAIGNQTLRLNLTGTSNTAVGDQSLEVNTASANTAVGASSLLLNTTGASNTACGGGALSANLIGNSNAALGANALLVATNSGNTAVGATALSTLTTGSNNTGIGFNAQPATATVNNTITLGDSAIATLRCQVTSITALSDARDKKDIVDIPAGLNFVQALRPVSFMWNMRDGGKIDVPEFGFIAQELQSAQATTGVTVPNLVSSENPERLEASQSTLIPVLVKAIQELKAELDSCKAQLTTLLAQG